MVHCYYDRTRPATSAASSETKRRLIPTLEAASFYSPPAITSGGVGEQVMALRAHDKEAAAFVHLDTALSD